MDTTTQHVVTRFAPSPTGIMTLGNYRTALWAYLFAQKHQGTFLLRIEDTDRERSQEAHVHQIMEDLKRMGIAYDQSNILYQSQRNAIYAQYFEELLSKGMAYRCYCSPEELALERKVQLSQKIPPRYSGKCRHLTNDQCAQIEREKGIQPVLRFAMEHRKIEFTDLVLGPKVFEGKDIGDFVIRKQDGDPTFFFCNAIDDALSGVTHALRGDDHLTNTPRQIAILDALNLRKPFYGHLPLILGSDHQPLSKRNGSLSIKDLLQRGFLPEAVNNYCARLGHHCPENTPYTLEQLGQSFDLTKISSSPAHFDLAQLMDWQRRLYQEMIQKHPTEAVQALDNRALIQEPEAFIALVWPHVAIPSELNLWAQRLHSPQIVSEERCDWSSYGWTPEILEFAQTLIGKSWTEWKSGLEQKGCKGKNLFFPTRFLLTGSHDGPKLEELYHYVDQEILQNRIVEALNGYSTDL